jgi:hypothetical protein
MQCALSTSSVTRGPMLTQYVIKQVVTFVWTGLRWVRYSLVVQVQSLGDFPVSLGHNCVGSVNVALSTAKPLHTHCTNSVPIYGTAESKFVITVAVFSHCSGALSTTVRTRCRVRM